MSWAWWRIFRLRSICSCILVEWREFPRVEAQFWFLSIHLLEKVKTKHFLGPSSGTKWFIVAVFPFKRSAEGPKCTGKSEFCGLSGRKECRAMPEEGWWKEIDGWLWRGSYGSGRSSKRMSRIFWQKLNWDFPKLIFARVKFRTGLICAFWWFGKCQAFVNALQGFRFRPEVSWAAWR